MKERKKMEGEIYSFYRACLCVSSSLQLTPSSSAARLLLLLPVVFLFLLLPLDFTSIHFGGGLAFLFSWLANFKLLLLDFDSGPWSSVRSILFVQFRAIYCLPIRLAKNRSGSDLSRIIGAKLFAKSLLLGALICIVVFELIVDWDRNLVLLVYCSFVYLLLETGLATIAATVWALAGLELDPPFNAPHLSTSLQDFWRKRWNLVATDSLRLTIYEPCREWLSSFMNHVFLHRQRTECNCGNDAEKNFGRLYGPDLMLGCLTSTLLQARS